jgi:hypothetical protein
MTHPTTRQRLAIVATSAMTLALTLGTAGVAFAGQHHPSSLHAHQSVTAHRASGVVSALGAGSITLSHAKSGFSATFATTSATTFKAGGSSVGASALAVGQHVRLTLDSSTTPSTATNVEIAVARFEGKVTAVVGNVITITGPHAGARTVDVTSSTVYSLSGTPATLAAVTVGSEIGVRGLLVNATTINALKVKVSLAEATSVEGVVSAIGAGTLTLTHEHSGFSATFATTATTTYQSGGVTLNAAAVAVGQRVKLTLDTSTTPATATAVEIKSTTFEGHVTAVGASSFAITGPKGVALTVNVSSSTTFSLGGAVSSLGALSVGLEVNARGLLANATTLNAFTVAIH